MLALHLLGARDGAHFAVQRADCLRLRRTSSALVSRGESSRRRVDRGAGRVATAVGVTVIVIGIGIGCVRFGLRQQPEFNARSIPLRCAVVETIAESSAPDLLLLLPPCPWVDPGEIQQQPLAQQHNEPDGPSKHAQHVTRARRRGSGFRWGGVPGVQGLGGVVCQGFRV